MEIITQIKNDIPHKELAISLANADPSEFAAFWFEFNEACTNEKLDEFAKTMADSLGANRKKPLQKLFKLMEFYEIKAEKEALS